MNDSINPSAHPQQNAPADSSTQPNLTPQQRSTLYKIFMGADGLRAGWSLGVFIALLGALLGAVFAIGNRMHIIPKANGAAAEMAPGFTVFSEMIPFLATFLAAWIMSRIERRPNSLYGLGGLRALPNFFAGLAWGVACLSVLILTLWKAGDLVFDRRLLSGSEVFRYGAIWLVGFLMVGLLEEYLTRGYVLFTLTRGLAGIYSCLFHTRHSRALGFWTSALGLSILFGLGHGNNPGESPIGLLSAGLASLVFSFSLWRTGSLWWAIGFHASWDWAQSFLYGVADSGIMVHHHLFATHPLGKPLISGGTTGPEGSIFVLPMLAVISFIIIFTLPRTTYGDSAST